MSEPDKKTKRPSNPHNDNETAWFLWRIWDTACEQIESLQKTINGNTESLSVQAEGRYRDALTKMGHAFPDGEVYPKNHHEAGSIEWQLFENVLTQRRLQAASADAVNRATERMVGWVRLRDDMQMLFEFIGVPVDGKKKEKA